ncbi:hypothetical protein IWT140_01733 [Secundilactobacillus pentosiphilus]|uniref:Uncharacterized protein n=1 Tax=Secundilactobacillus pentosiphilus TaxID=1714682 RepID=A0A1Z5IQZ5_9LACO|nr:hypothetical protein IWT140_01733 [Secundilactobacillus pentosiphilus]
MIEAKTQQNCSYCHKPFQLFLHEPGISEYITISNNDYYLTTGINHMGFTNFHIRYCPKCGRKLGDEI